MDIRARVYSRGFYVFAFNRTDWLSEWSW